MNGDTKISENINSLDEFKGWGDSSNEGDFFKQVEAEESSEKDTTDAKEVIAQIAKDDESDKTKDEDNEKTPKEKNLFNEDTEENDDVEGSDETEDEDSDMETSSISTLNHLKDKGFIEFDLEEGEELTDEKAEELLEDKFDEAVEDRVKELFEDLPEPVRHLNKYVMDGGNIATFFDSLVQSNSTQITDDIDLNEESNQALVIREMLKAEGNDDEEIETQLGYLKENGKLKLISEKKFQKWQNKNRKAQEELAASQAEARKQEKENIRENKRKTTSFLSEVEDIGELQVTKKDKKTIPSYMNDKTIKLQNGSSITELQKELFYDVPKNEKAFMQLAILMKNRNEDGTFNFESITKNTETKVVREVKANVRRSKMNIPNKSKGKRNSYKKPLSDYFN